MRRSSSPPFARIAAALCASLALASTAGCGGAAAPLAPTPSAARGGGLIGAPAPELSAEVVAGEGPATLDEARGKVVLVDFWATYCAPCRKSFPKYQEIADRFGDEVAVIAISIDAPEDVSKEDIAAFADEAGVRFKILWDKDERTVKRYRPPTMPTAYVIDRGGIVRHVHVGYASGEEERLSREIAALLGEAAPPSGSRGGAPTP